MELKQWVDIKSSVACRILLIVPYGIETSKKSDDTANGITFNRTLWNWNYSSYRFIMGLSWLLIVPYGIETILPHSWVRPDWLLIVPYGIETQTKLNQQEEYKTFNRTLWNWNVWESVVYFPAFAFNRTLWNWNLSSDSVELSPRGLLIVPYGIETGRDRSSGNGLTTLLIVPYGIETKFDTRLLCQQFLLIVPYGIETFSTSFFILYTTLLIVPYGIETTDLVKFRNRIGLLIVPYGIETRQRHANRHCSESF